MSIAFGVLEFWSIGVLEKAKTPGIYSKKSCITPLLHYSTTPFLQLTRVRKRLFWARILYFVFSMSNIYLSPPKYDPPAEKISERYTPNVDQAAEGPKSYEGQHGENVNLES
jgi:hypothetical protein